MEEKSASVHRDRVPGWWVGECHVGRIFVDG